MSDAEPTTWVVSVHWGTDRWIGLQADSLDRHLAGPYVHVVGTNGIDSRHLPRPARLIPVSGSHADNLDRLIAGLDSRAAHNDLLLVLDGDAILVNSPSDLFARIHSGDVNLIAARRDENLGDPQPHPLFCTTTYGFWRRHGLSWGPGPRWRTATGARTTDVGALVWEFFGQHPEFTWQPLLRSNGFDAHPLHFGLYGDVVYHHGAAFRDALCRLDLQHVLGRGFGPLRRLARAPGIGSWIQRRIDARTAPLREAIGRQSEHVYAMLRADLDSVVDSLRHHSASP